MRFKEIFAQQRAVLSLEFFPPKQEDALPSALEMIKKLSGYSPDFMTVTYGAGGSTRGLTAEMIGYVTSLPTSTAVQHLTCVGHSRADIDDIEEDLYSRGVRNVLALRGDPPKGTTSFVAREDGFSCARDLVRHLAAKNRLSLAVAGYPEVHTEAKSEDDDLRYLKEKVDAGAELIVTQLFFEPDIYFRFVEKLKRLGIDVPVSAGVMPIGNANQVRRFTSMCGASIPTAISAKLVELENNPDDIRKYGTEYAIEQCRKLLAGGAQGLHLYTLNQSSQAEPILRALIAEGFFGQK
jgi:methylenetetrahydrofolate reductase (NADPH)